MNISDKEFMRYSRQILLSNVGEHGQIRIKTSQAIIVGVGGLGTLVAHYLAAAGVGEIVLVDGDKVESSNLPRQLLFSENDIGKNKATVAFIKLQQQYPNIHINVRAEMFTDVLQLDYSKQTVVFDCCDNFESRHLINRFCVKNSLPLISAAAANFSGQLFAYYPSMSGCYNCLYPEQIEVNDNCRSVGILGPMVGTLASMQALIGLKVMLGDKQVFGKLWLFDGNTFQWRTALLEQDPSCSVCVNTEQHVIKESVA
ncbi:HesA/MoeB/ThiF family protein [Shewanella sp. 202IG2-18]|uniref:HesA/MoeB/ThiF family protein n=1 Tax=Parashewanella hymeniacidonis TaxID=2807618 RepID=UPI00196223EE|nr:HesA/MoeB/ThiF family protein [Parashewanella hymeniacidonis]MBM7072722.1 HesA/MoeB/ThiF family protein [Parashewanella hymeniacidonis]